MNSESMSREIKFRAWYMECDDIGKMFNRCMPCTDDFKYWMIDVDESGGAFDGDFKVGEDLSLIHI